SELAEAHDDADSRGHPDAGSRGESLDFVFFAALQDRSRAEKANAGNDSLNHPRDTFLRQAGGAGDNKSCRGQADQHVRAQTRGLVGTLPLDSHQSTQECRRQNPNDRTGQLFRIVQPGCQLLPQSIHHWLVLIHRLAESIPSTRCFRLSSAANGSGQNSIILRILPSWISKNEMARAFWTPSVTLTSLTPSASVPTILLMMNSQRPCAGYS